MVSKKNKRKIVYEGTNYYWYVRINDVGRILRTFKIKKKVEVTDNGKDDF